MENKKLKVVQFVNELGFGCTSKTAVKFSIGLAILGLDVELWSLKDGPRSKDLISHGINVKIVDIGVKVEDLGIDIFHYHDSGLKNDFINQILPRFSKDTKVVLTNVFGGFCNIAHQYISTKLFVSEATLLKYVLFGGEVDKNYSVLYNPVQENKEVFIENIKDRSTNKFIIGRIARPDILKWDADFELLLKILKYSGFDFKLKIVGLPDEVKIRINQLGIDVEYYDLLSSNLQLDNFYSSLDILVHLSSIGESFGCVFVEAMNYGIPVIVKSTPFSKFNFWRDNAQIEVIESFKTGYVCNSLLSMRDAILLASNNRIPSGEIKKINQEKFSSEQIISQLFIIYNNTVNESFKSLSINYYEERYLHRLKNNIFKTPIISTHHRIMYLIESFIVSVDSFWIKIQNKLQRHKYFKI